MRGRGEGPVPAEGGSAVAALQQQLADAEARAARAEGALARSRADADELRLKVHGDTLPRGNRALGAGRRVLGGHLRRQAVLVVSLVFFCAGLLAFSGGYGAQRAQSRLLGSGGSPPRAAAGASKPVYPPPAVLGNWALNVTAHQSRISSGGTQDGALMYIFDTIGHGAKYFVEFGYDSNSREGGFGSNTYNLFKHGWNGLLMDGANNNASINLHKEWIRPGNIADLFLKYKVPSTPDYVSIDIDTADLWILRALLDDGRYLARVFTIEYNCVWPLEATVTNHWQTPWLHDRMMGTSLGAIKMVADAYGYTLVDVVHCLDAILVRNDLLQGSPAQPLETWRENTGVTTHSEHFYLHPRVADRSRISDGSIVDYAVWVETNGDEKAAAASAAKQVEDLRVPI